MLVPAMTLEEIQKEIQKELSSVANKMMFYKDKISKQIRKTNITRFQKIYDYDSLQKNKWMLGVTYKNKDFSFTLCVMHESARGQSAIIYSIGSKTYYYLTSHFIKRFDERLNLNLVQPREKVKYFISNTTDLNYKLLGEHKPGIYKFFGVCQTGVVLGTYHTAINMFKQNTFLANDMLNKGQSELAVFVEPRINPYLRDAEMGD